MVGFLESSSLVRDALWVKHPMESREMPCFSLAMTDSGFFHDAASDANNPAVATTHAGRIRIEINWRQTEAWAVKIRRGFNTPILFTEPVCQPCQSMDSINQHGKERAR